MRATTQPDPRHLGTLLLVLVGFLAPALRAQEGYVAPQDPLVRRKLEEWRDRKFGLILHWGTYSQRGIVESWSLCSEDEPWCRRDIDDYEEYKRRYEALAKTFNPRRFDPQRWAAAAWAAGMRYVIFTTKHHDGFCMFDTHQSSYRVTAPDCPFHTNPRADLTRAIFDAFRARGFSVGAYFSKPDWHSDLYWWRRFATPDRHVNYDPARYPERWRRFQDYCYRQIEELMSGYGRVDILWLDGAWVRPLANMPAKYESWARKRDWNQDIDMGRIAAMARRHQPGLLIVDRWVSGPYENYLTPEQRVPDEALEVPWESCVTMGSSWSYSPRDKMKPVGELVHLLVDVVVKGGNLLLGIGPDGNGELPPKAYERLAGLAEWMRVNGSSIYATRAIAPYKEGRIGYTRGRDGAIYAIYLGARDQIAPPAVITLGSHRPPSGGSVHLLGVDQPLRWEPHGKGCRIHLPPTIVAAPPCRYAWALRLAGR